MEVVSSGEAADLLGDVIDDVTSDVSAETEVPFIAMVVLISTDGADPDATSEAAVSLAV